MLTFIENRNLVEDPEMRVYITSLSEPSTRLSVTVPILDMVVAQWSMEPETTEVVKLDVEWQLGSEDTGFQSYKSKLFARCVGVTVSKLFRSIRSFHKTIR